MLCFIALILYRVMRSRLKHADASPERALEQLRALGRHRVRLKDAEPIDGISSIDAGQAHRTRRGEISLHRPHPPRPVLIPFMNRAWGNGYQ